MNENILDQDWTPGSLLRFALPSIVMMLFMGLYTIVDSIFVARFVNTDALSAINIVCPVLNAAVGLGTMLATGGNAIVSRKLGEDRNQEAREDFTLLILAGGAAGFLLLAGGALWLEDLIRGLGASPRLFPYCRDYLLILLLFLPANVLQTLFSNLFVTAGRPVLGFGLTVLAGGANILLDYLFIVPLDLGIKGAALGTAFGWLIPSAAGLVYFAVPRGPLFFTRPVWKPWVLLESCCNGASEMVSQLASAVTTFLFNRAMMRLLGEDGVAAITILIYAQFLLNTLFIGFSIGIAPITGFNYGSRKDLRQRRVFAISLGFIAAASLLVFGASLAGGPFIADLFAGQAPSVRRIAAGGFRIFSFSFLFCGLNIFTSAFFTALSNGLVSAVLSFLRTFGLLSAGILLLPRLWGLTGVWLAVPLAEAVMFFASAACLACFRKRYGY